MLKRSINLIEKVLGFVQIKKKTVKFASDYIQENEQNSFYFCIM